MSDTTLDLNARIATATTYVPAWIAQQLAVFGDDLSRAVESDRYSTVLTATRDAFAAPGGTARSLVISNAMLVYWQPDLRATRERLTVGQARRFTDLLAHLLYWDASGTKMPGGEV